MRSLKDIVRQNKQAVADHDPTLLNDSWPEGQPVYLPPSKAKRSASRFIYGTDVTLAFVRHQLGYNLRGAEQGLTEVIRTERNLPAGEPIALDPFLLWVFSLGCSTALVEEWVSALSETLAPYASHPAPSFTIKTDRVVITIRNNVVEEIAPLPKASGAKRCG